MTMKLAIRGEVPDDARPVAGTQTVAARYCTPHCSQVHEMSFASPALSVRGDVKLDERA
jgi:hypothetical protein